MPQKPQRLTGRELISLIADSDTFISWDSTPQQPDLGTKYRAELTAAQERSGEDESIITGEASIGGRRVALIASEFLFLAGSLGRAASTRFVAAMERATREKLPVLVSPASGGTRMQEGTAAFVAMVNIAESVANHHQEGLPYLVYLRHPSTGGALASFGSLGQVTVAEPGALVGFLGPRVFEAIYGEAFPEGVQKSENLAQLGIIDGVLPPSHLREVVERTLRLLQKPSHLQINEIARATDRVTYSSGSEDAWGSVQRTRLGDRPGLRHLLRYAATDIVRLSGTGQGERDPGLALCLAKFGNIPAVVVGQDRQAQRMKAPLGPGALRAARRAMHLAEELRLPLVTVIDTPGADLSQEAEEGALAAEIARCLADLATREGPTLSLLLGEGTGGGALALLPADVTLAAEHAWLAPLPPEGASAIKFRDTKHANHMAQQQGVESATLQRNGIVDFIIPEPDDLGKEARSFCVSVGNAIEHQLAQLMLKTPDERRHDKQLKYSLG